MKKWYVLQIYSGYEDQIKEDLEKRINKLIATDVDRFNEFGKIVIPSVKVNEVFLNSSQNDIENQLFPGYILCELLMSPQNIDFILDTPRVLRFLGNRNPIALSKNEVDKIFEKIEGKVVVSRKNEEFVLNSEVTIESGPFTGFVGIIEKINNEAELLVVMVSILGRMTPVELRFSQVKK